jgi:hypothetical protein
MSSLPLFRVVTAVALALGLATLVPGCNPKPQPTNTEEKKGSSSKGSPSSEPKPAPTDTPNSGSSGTATLPPQPAKVDINSGVGKEAVDFLQAVRTGSVPAAKISTGYSRLIGLPVELPSDKAKGYSADAAESWLRRVGNAVPFGLPLMAYQAGDVALFRGALAGKSGGYALRLIQEGGAWKVDWLSASSVEVKPSLAGPTNTAEALFQEFVATAGFEAICDKDGMGKDERIAAIAAGMTPALRAKWGPPFDGDKAKGYDYNAAQLGLEIAKIGGGVESVTFAPQGDGVFKAEVVQASGAKAAYLIKLTKGTTPGQWLVESITPQ